MALGGDEPAGAGALVLASLSGGIQSADAVSSHANLHAQRVCASAPQAGHATCFAKVLVNGKGAIPNATSPLPSALSPAQLRSAYNLNGASGAGRTVAIVDAYGYPNLERDLTIYRNYYGMLEVGVAFASVWSYPTAVDSAANGFQLAPPLAILLGA